MSEAPASWSSAERVRRLVHAFEEIARTRMDGLPLLNSRLRVEAVGFEQYESGEGASAERGLMGVLVTPWFMNLIWLPEDACATPRLGAPRTRRIGKDEFVFIGASVDGAGAFDTCSLCSPMFEFDDQQDARETAAAVLELLRGPAGTPGKKPVLSRRIMLFGRAQPAEELG